MTKTKNKTNFSLLMSLYINEKAEYFDACMMSIFNQTVMPTEIVIVKDGPVTREVEQVLQKYVNRRPDLFNIVAYSPNRGLGYALSKGVIACSNELIARMDTDDLARKDRFEKQLAEFEKNATLDICGSNINEFENTPKKIIAHRNVPLNDAEIKDYQKKRDAFNHMTVMYKKSSVLKAGNYSMCLLMEDTLLWVNMMQSGAICMNIGEPLVYARIGMDMYERRGGLSYFIKYRNGRKKVKETGYISFWDYYYTILIQLCVAIIPSQIRGWVFRNILHRKGKIRTRKVT